MIQIYPLIAFSRICPSCDTGKLKPSKILWQGAHICTEASCSVCGNQFWCDLPIAQGAISPYCLSVSDTIIYDKENIKVSPSKNWYTSLLTRMYNYPQSSLNIKISRKILKEPKKNIIILNTLNYVYGHSLLQFLNLPEIINNVSKDFGIVVIIQPFLEWLIPFNDIQEVWSVNLSLKDGKYFYPEFSQELNTYLKAYEKVYLSEAHILPYPVDISLLTGVEKFSFAKPKGRITFIWREDVGRLWIKNWYIHKILSNLGLGDFLTPFHYIRTLRLLRKLYRRIDRDKFTITLAGLGNYGKFPDFVDDQRIKYFNSINEKKACQIYGDSILVVGIHGSSMILPSAHSGMCISLMPSKRWGNFSEDILPNSENIRLGLFENRILPITIRTGDLVDICCDMINGRSYFISKFIYNSKSL